MSTIHAPVDFLDQINATSLDAGDDARCEAAALSQAHRDHQRDLLELERSTELLAGLLCQRKTMDSRHHAAIDRDLASTRLIIVNELARAAESLSRVG